MSLYDDIEVPQNTKSVIGATSGGKDAPSVKQTAWKPPSLALMAPPIIRRPPVGRGAAKPSIGRGIGRGIRPPSTSSPPPPPEPHATAQPSEPFANDDDEDDDDDERLPPDQQSFYDPEKPNDYQQFCIERMRREKEERLKQELEEMEKKREQQRLARIELEKKMEAEKAEAEADLTGDDIYRRRALMSGAGDTSLPSTGDGPQTGEEAFLLRQRLSERSAAATSADDDDTATPAMRMMSKMGWTGLGKHGQGMLTPIELKKTAGNAGVIVNLTPQGTPVKKGGVVLNQPPSRVLLLKNMVAPGQVDDQLERETAEECSKYGEVKKVIVFEKKAVDPEDAVRIFVEFSRQESAIKARVDLDGRFFGGRAVKAQFYDERPYERRQLDL